MFKHFVKKYMPKAIWGWLRDFRAFIAYILHVKQIRNVEKVVKNRTAPLNVLFLAIWDNNWKYDSVFKSMMKSSYFNPMIIVCPVVSNGREYMLKNLQQCCRFFESKKYPYICSYNEADDSYVDIRQYKPDIIFYTSPYAGIIDSHYRYNQYKDVLSCYVNYFYVTSNEPWACAEEFHKYMWRYYLEYPLLRNQICKLVKPYRVNGNVVGYPLFDAFRLHEVSDSDWPIKSKQKKRIIWAPHHTVNGYTDTYAMSTFEKYYDFMWQMAEKFKQEIDIVFKPHPLLKPHLYEAEGWGKERTDAYYEKWSTGDNTAFVDGEYVGLFLASDAMIHDCNSFTVEYLAVNKPAMFLDSGMTENQINQAGKEARACYYKGYCEEDIEKFIRMIIEGGKDELKEKREAFYKNYILPPNGKLAAENIIDDLLTSLGRR